MNQFARAEQAVYEILSYDKTISGMVRQIHTRLKDANQYKDRIPAMGIKCLDVSHDPETGEETATGICEVVTCGEYNAATESAENIAGKVYDKLTTYSMPGGDLKVAINGITATGMKSVGGDVDGRFYALCHVSWQIDL